MLSSPSAKVSLIRNKLLLTAWSILLLFLIEPVYSQAQDLKEYDSEFFSIKYPSSWHISTEPWVTDIPGTTGVILDNNQTDINRSNRITPHSNMGHSVIVVTVMPRSSLLGSNDLSASELVDSFVDFTFSAEKLSEYGAQLIADNYTSISGIQARSVSYTTGGYYYLLLSSADESNMYQITYVGQESRYQKELHEVQSIISSFKIKGINDTPILSTA